MSCVEVYMFLKYIFCFMSLVDCNPMPNSPLNALIAVFLLAFTM